MLCSFRCRSARRGRCSDCRPFATSNCCPRGGRAACSYYYFRKTCSARDVGKRCLRAHVGETALWQLERRAACVASSVWARECAAGGLSASTAAVLRLSQDARHGPIFRTAVDLFSVWLTAVLHQLCAATMVLCLQCLMMAGPLAPSETHKLLAGVEQQLEEQRLVRAVSL